MEGPVSRKLFTVAQANEVLPRVERLVLALRDRIAWMQTRPRQITFMLPDQQVINESPVDPDYFKTLLMIRKMLQEVDGLGAQVKDLGSGLVDFPSRLHGRDILLCWQVGERRVAFYHDMEAGFAGRQPIPDELRDAGPGEEES
jgi:hypothetical protein